MPRFSTPVHVSWKISKQLLDRADAEHHQPKWSTIFLQKRSIFNTGQTQPVKGSNWQDRRSICAHLPQTARISYCTLAVRWRAKGRHQGCLCHLWLNSSLYRDFLQSRLFYLFCLFVHEHIPSSQQSIRTTGCTLQCGRGSLLQTCWGWYMRVKTITEMSSHEFSFCW